MSNGRDMEKEKTPLTCIVIKRIALCFSSNAVFVNVLTIGYNRISHNVRIVTKQKKKMAK